MANRRTFCKQYLLIIYYSHIEIFGPYIWDFISDGSGLAKAENPLFVYKRITINDSWKFPVAQSQVTPYDKWLYLFEVENNNKQSSLYLSRVLQKNIENPNAYEYYTGSELNFSRYKNERKIFLKDIYGQVSVEWNQYLGFYVMATPSDFAHSREIWFRTSKKPYGPWSNSISKIEVPNYCQGKKVELIYCTHLHPELFKEDGRIMNLTFSLILKDSEFDANNKMVEIEIVKNE